MKLKEQMGVENICRREKELVNIVFQEFEKIPEINVLADNVKDRLGCISFYVNDLHYNLFVKLLSDRFGIQVRGGCACAGTYGHYLLHVDYEKSKSITSLIETGNLSAKPGWVRLSLHPTMTNNEVYYILDSIKQIVNHRKEWEKDYVYNAHTNEFHHIHFQDKNKKLLSDWFSL